MHENAITVKNNLIGTVTVTKENYGEVLDDWRSAAGNGAVPDLEALQILGICPIPLITPFSHEAMRVYRATDGGNRISTPEEYYSQPAVYLQVCDIIRGEEFRIAEEEDKRRGNKSGKIRASDRRER